MVNYFKLYSNGVKKLNKDYGMLFKYIVSLMPKTRPLKWR